MRALIISDIHANLPALKAVLAAAPEHDTVWNLGDIVGYGASPNEVADIARSLGGIVVRGNHDRACSDPDKFSQQSHMSPVAATAAIWTNQVLTDENRKWLSGLPRGPVKPSRLNLICVHGSPRDEDEYISRDWPAETAFTALANTGARIAFFGHTHEQIALISTPRAFYPVEPEYPREGIVQFRLRLSRRNRYLLNPGSVGQPRDGDWRVAFALYDGDQRTVTWHRVPYDVRTAQRRIRRAKLPETLASRLQGGM